MISIDEAFMKKISLIELTKNNKEEWDEWLNIEDNEFLLNGFEYTICTCCDGSGTQMYEDIDNTDFYPDICDDCEGKGKTEKIRINHNY